MELTVEAVLIRVCTSSLLSLNTSLTHVRVSSEERVETLDTNLSFVSSVSTLSSEDGSDAGVSLSYDPKTSPEKTTGNMYLNVLKKNKTQQQHNQAPKAAAGVVLTKVNFTGSKPPFPSETPKTSTFTTNQLIRSSPVSHVTQKHSSETKVTEPPTKDVVDNGTSKSLYD